MKDPEEARRAGEQELLAKVASYAVTRLEKADLDFFAELVQRATA